MYLHNFTCIFFCAHTHTRNVSVCGIYICTYAFLLIRAYSHVPASQGSTLSCAHHYRPLVLQFPGLFIDSISIFLVIWNLSIFDIKALNQPIVVVNDFWDEHYPNGDAVTGSRLSWKIWEVQFAASRAFPMTAVRNAFRSGSFQDGPSPNGRGMVPFTVARFNGSISFLFLSWRQPMYIYIYIYINIWSRPPSLHPTHGLGPQVAAPIPFYLQAIGSISEVQLRIC